MRRFISLSLYAISLATLSLMAADTPADAAKAKKGLQEIGEFVGQWNLTADPPKGSAKKAWKETHTISWKFKDADAWLVYEIKGSPKDATGELRYDPAKKNYTLALVAKDKSETRYVGEFKKGKLILETKDDATKNVSKMTMNTISEGVRLSVLLENQAGGSGPFETAYKAVGNKEGESLAGGKTAKKPECIVTGGTASIAVTYMGKTYYVCCSGCRDEFNENPKKYIDAAEKAKK